MKNNVVGLAGFTGTNGLIGTQNIDTGELLWLKTPGTTQSSRFVSIFFNDVKNEWTALGSTTNSSLQGMDGWGYSTSSDGTLDTSFVTGGIRS